jgi:hypothetical protein
VSGNVIFIEGGGKSKELRTRCREGFHKLFERCQFPQGIRLKARGGRDEAFSSFKIAHSAKAPSEYVAMLIDSEEPVTAGPWEHLKQRDPSWLRPHGTTDDQVLLMTTCMETWIVSDRATLRQHYQNCLNENPLPAAVNLEERPRDEVQKSLSSATKSCSNAYKKDSRSFEILAKLNPEVLQSLPSFARMRRILQERLRP